MIFPLADCWRTCRRYPRFFLPGLAFLGLASYLLVSNVWAAVHFRAAQQALRQRDFDRARGHLASCLQVWTTSARTHLLAARAAWRSGFYDAADEHLAICRRQQLGADALQRERALVQLQRGDTAAENVLCTRVERDDPETPLILEILIQHYVSSYRLPRALDALNAFLRRRPNDAQALLGRGWVWEQFFDFGRAAQDYQRAVHTDPENDAARLRLAETLLITGPASAALEHLETVRQRQPGNAAVLLALARSHRQLGQLKEAKLLLGRLLSRLPSGAPDRDGVVLGERGRLALDEGEPVQAERWLQQAIALLPYDRQVNYNLYQCLQQQGRTEEACPYRLSLQRMDADLQRLDKLLKEVLRAPNDAALRSEAGVIFLRNGEAEKGLRWLTMALQQDPWHRPTHQALADYYERAGRFDVAAHHRRFSEGVRHRSER